MINLKTNDYESKVPGSKTYKFELEMVPYNDHRTRTVRVWLPPQYDGKKRFPVVYLHDGQDQFSRKGEPEKIDADEALFEKNIEAILVGIDNSSNRGQELTPPYKKCAPDTVVHGHRIPIIPGESTTPQYAEFIVKYVKPLIDEIFLTLSDRDNTYVGGISAGGSTSFYMFLEYPDVFGKAMVLSPGFPMFELSYLLNLLDDYNKELLSGRRILFYNGNTGMDMTSVDYVLAVYRKFMELGMDSSQTMFLLDSRQGHCDEAWKKWFPEIFDFIFTGKA